MPVRYTRAQIRMLSQRRADILRRPGAYKDGYLLLQSRFGQERIRQEVMEEWERNRSDPTWQKANQDTARREAQVIANPAQRAARYREVLEQLSAPPSPNRWSPAACVCRALQELMDAMDGPYHDAVAQAVLLLAVLLWDADADKRHHIFALLGPWGVTPSGEREGLGRWAATYFLHYPAVFDRWKDTVRKASIAFPIEYPESAADGSGVRFEGDIQGADARKLKQKLKIGRPSITVGEARRRHNLIAAYRQRRGQTKKQFCAANGVKLKYLETCLAWERQRRKRAKK